MTTFFPYWFVQREQLWSPESTRRNAECLLIVKDLVCEQRLEAWKEKTDKKGETEIKQAAPESFFNQRSGFIPQLKSLLLQTATVEI